MLAGKYEKQNICVEKAIVRSAVCRSFGFKFYVVERIHNSDKYVCFTLISY